jgi:hypothetical protein
MGGALMKYTLRIKVSPEAYQLTTPEERSAIATSAMKKAEQMDLRPNDVAIFDGLSNLKVVISWGTKAIHIMTKGEADVAYLPNKGSVN